MHHYNSVLSLHKIYMLTISAIANCDLERQYRVVVHGACVWLVFILVIISCTCLPLYFLHLFSNIIQVVPVVLTPVQLGTFLIF